MTAERVTSLWRHPGFLKLWSGQTVSMLGTQVTLLAVPLTAVLTLHATAFQMGVLQALSFAPFLLFGLPAGVWMDRRRKRPVLVAADVGRALLLVSIPAAAAFGVLGMGQLFLVAFLSGTLTLAFEVAYESFLPFLVPRQHLTEANGRLETSLSVSQVVGPGLAGALVQLLTAPIAMLVDAASFLVSALSVAAITEAAEPPARGRAAGGSLQMLREGAAVLLRSPVLAPITICTAVWNLGYQVTIAILVLYATTQLGLQPAVLGTTFAIGAFGSLAGAAIASRMARALTIGRTLVVAMALATLGALLAPLAPAQAVAALVFVAAGQALKGFGIIVYNVNQISLRQAVTPPELQGRVHATFRFAVWGTFPIGALIGGGLGSAIGLRPALLVGVGAMVVGALALALTPVGRLRQIDAPAAAEPV